MSRAIEVELKFEISDPVEVANYVQKLEVLGKKRIVDEYLDTRDAALFVQGVFIRIRNGQKFDIKFNADDILKTREQKIEHTHCDEVSNELPLTDLAMDQINSAAKILQMAPMVHPDLTDFVNRNDLVPSLVIDKRRTSYQAGEFHIDIDTVEGLGSFLEIEKMTDELGDREALLSRMHEQLRGLEIKHVDVGYNELYWRKHNFDLYLKGKYLLAEDRKTYRPESLGAVAG